MTAIRTIFQHLHQSFYDKELFNVEFILETMKEWAEYYINYTNPCENKSYDVRHLYYLRTMGNTSLIPAVMRTLETDLNKKVSNQKPEDKTKYWNQSCLKNYYLEAKDLKEMKINQTNHLINLFNEFKNYCSFNEKNAPDAYPDLQIVSYHINNTSGEYEKMTDYQKPDRNICSISIKDRAFTAEPEFKNENNSIVEYRFITKKEQKLKPSSVTEEKLKEVFHRKDKD